MNRLAFTLLASFFALPSPALAKDPPRPHIAAIASVTFLSSDIPASLNFYETMGLYRPPICDRCKSLPSSTIYLPHGRTIALKNISTMGSSSLLDQITFYTPSMDALAAYLSAKKINFHREKVTGLIALDDPEGHHIAFAPTPKHPPLGERLVTAQNESSLTVRLVHAGFIVRDRERMEHFYKDILGFRPYWHGGMKDDETSWVSLQVPDGTDWLEFMLYDPTGKDKHFLGVMNHIALGVTDIHATQEQLRKNGAPLTEEPKIGRDGKWQLNLYDPDETRIEFMEFTPVQKPCCSEFTAPHPKP